MATTDPTQLPGKPVAPDEAQGAQVPLQTFTVPAFPSEAKGLKALTLTSDIKATEYQDLLCQPFSIPALPVGIESLTLELFIMGYPVGFLAALAEKLPNLKSVVVYSQLFAGTTTGSMDDAVEFFKRLPNLRALHLLDVFANNGFFPRAAKWLKYNTSNIPGEARRGLMFLEVSYTFRHEDETFMSRIQAIELPSLIGPGLITCSFNLADSDNKDKSDHPTNSPGGGKEGIMAFKKSLASSLIDALTDEETCPKGLRALNTTIYTLTLEQLQKVLKVQKHVMVLNITAEVEPGEVYKQKLVALLEELKKLEQVEIVANPSLEFFMSLQHPQSDVLAQTFPNAPDLVKLSKRCEALSSLKANILRATSFGTIEWEKRQDGTWEGGVN